MSAHQYRLDIEGLRALAVLSVVGFHASPNWIPGGFVGVDIFFVISGYLITRNIYTSQLKNLFSLSDFYSRRIRRIFPALCLVLIFTAGLGWFHLLALEYRNLGKHIAGAASFIENILYYHEQGYFDESSLNKPLLQLWSLGVEEQFYLGWPLLLWVVNRWRLKLVAVILAVIAISFLSNIYGGVSSSASSFFLVQSRIWELALGSLLALPLFQYCQSHHKWLALVHRSAPYVGVGLIVVSVFTFTKNFWFPGWWALMPTIGAWLVIYGNPGSGISRHFLSNRVLVWFGKISFPLYLWHWVLLSFLFIMVPEDVTRNARVIVVLASIVLSWVTYKYIETPFRANIHTARKVTILVVTMTGLFVFGLTAFLNDGFPNRYFAQYYKEVENAITDWQFPQGLVSQSVKGHSYVSTSGNSPVIAFIGDSHIDQFSPRALDLYNKGQLGDAAFITFNGCPPIPGVFEDKHPNCDTFVDNINATLEALPSIKTVVIGGCWNCYFGLETRPVPDFNNFNYVYRSKGVEAYFRKGRGAELALDSLETYLKELSQHYKVFLILDNQMADENDPRQVIKNRINLYKNEGLQGQLSLNQEQKALNARMRALAGRAGASVIDPLPTLCPGDVCPIFSAPGVPIFKDNHHLRSSYVADHATFIDQVQPK